jgi:hypothetical protein
MTTDEAIKWLEEAPRYFRNLSAVGEDRVHWANIYNSDNCLKIAELIKDLTKDDRVSD